MYNGSILYHYTDFQAIDGILRCAQLRVNNVLRMNDSAEMRHFMKRLCAAIVDRLNQEGDPERAEEIWQRRDDAAQWERYGNRGRGICVAFQREYLQKMAKGALSLQKVFYQDDMAGHPMVEGFCRLAREEEALSVENAAVRQAMCTAWACSVSFKHPSFSSEYEMRLVVSPFENSGFDIKPCCPVTKERIKKYYPLDLKAMCGETGIGIEDLVTEIIIGPDSTQSPAIFQDYLRDNGLNALAQRVSLSDGPLRGLIK